MPKKDNGGVTLFGQRMDDVPTPLKYLIVLLAAVGLGAWFWVREVDSPTKRYLSEQQANERIRQEMAEYQKHAGKEPVPNLVLVEGLPPNNRGRVTAGIYDDLCLLTKRVMADGTERSVLVRGLDRDIDVPANLSGLFHQVQEFVFTTVYAATACDRLQHGGPLSQPQEVGRQGEWILIQYWYGDGCSFVQPYNYVYNIWGDRRWVVCKH